MMMLLGDPEFKNEKCKNVIELKGALRTIAIRHIKLERVYRC
jgi:hypothetical protein